MKQCNSILMNCYRKIHLQFVQHINLPCLPVHFISSIKSYTPSDLRMNSTRNSPTAISFLFYMGSEDADLDELGHIYLSGDTLRWNTSQTGAVGRMNTKGLESIIHRIE